MNPHELDQRLKEFWEHGGKDSAAATTVIQAALAHPPLNPIVAARCLQVMEGQWSAVGEAWRKRIDDEYKPHVARLIARCQQLDKLGDDDTDPEAVFEILGEAVDDVPIEQLDAEALRQARRGAGRNRPLAASRLLNRLGWNYLPDDLAGEFRAVSAALSERGDRYKAHGLFVDSEGRGFVLGLQVAPGGQEVNAFATVNAAMAQQSKLALHQALEGAGAGWEIEWILSFEGESIGLGLYVAGRVARSLLPEDPLLAATGKVDVDGTVHAVAGIEAKVRAAARSGFRRVLIPKQNEEEARAVSEAAELEVIAVDRVGEVTERLARVSAAQPLGFDGLVRLVRKLIPLYALDVVDERDLSNGYRFEVADAGGKAHLDVFHGRRGTVQAAGAQGSALISASKLIEERLTKFRIEPRQGLSRLVANADRQERLQQLLVAAGAEELKAGQHERWRYRLTRGASQATVILYGSGKCVISSGQAPAFDEADALVLKVLEGLGGASSTENARRKQSKSEGPGPPLETEPHIGTDESGKGDFFGPLVSAAVYVDARSAEALRALGVRDSKLLTDRAVRRMAPEIRLVARRFAVTPINPARYNSLYEEMRREGKNLNTLLAWGHARSIEDLLKKGVRARYVIVDQFADTRFMQQKILADTRESGLPIKQMPKAEADVAVAAASILARDAFLAWMERHSARLQTTLPKGASDRVVEVAREIVKRQGSEALRDLVKLSFKTTQKVLATPSGESATDG
jgi:ribonuclease HIII